MVSRPYSMPLLSFLTRTYSKVSSLVSVAKCPHLNLWPSALTCIYVQVTSPAPMARCPHLPFVFKSLQLLFLHHQFASFTGVPITHGQYLICTYGQVSSLVRCSRVLISTHVRFPHSYSGQNILIITHGQVFSSALLARRPHSHPWPGVLTCHSHLVNYKSFL